MRDQSRLMHSEGREVIEKSKEPPCLQVDQYTLSLTLWGGVNSGELVQDAEKACKLLAKCSR